MRIHLQLKSDNAKTGKIPVSTSPNYTCPPSCGMFDTCYGKFGPLAIHWGAVSRGERGDWWPTFLGRVRDLPVGQAWRHNAAGDLPGYGDEIDIDLLFELTAAQKGKRGWTYTHKPPTVSNLRAVHHANRNGFTVNLSADNLKEADELMSTAVGPVVVVVPRGTDPTSYTPAGRKIVLCPAQQRKGITCESCMLCQRVDRTVIVGFVAHGTAVKRTEVICKQ